eukprot:scaffold317_cov260-Pinguiococcus_pyrenoidosus.AAC.32
MAENGDWDAAKERVVREIMCVDHLTAPRPANWPSLGNLSQVSWDEAQPTFDKINKANTKGMFLAAFPYRLGVFTALTAFLGSFPMVFDLHTALVFNELYVTTDVPPPEDLETWLEVGSWTWNWMEPPLGTSSASQRLSASQVALDNQGLALARAQMQNMNIKPYTQWLKDTRARRLALEFPQYNGKILEVRASC